MTAFKHPTWLAAFLALAVALAGCADDEEATDDGVNDPDTFGDPQDDGLDTTNDPDALGDPEDDGVAGADEGGLDG